MHNSCNQHISTTIRCRSCVQVVATIGFVMNTAKMILARFCLSASYSYIYLLQGCHGETVINVTTEI